MVKILTVDKVKKKERERRYYQKNKEEILKQRKEYYNKNKSSIRKTQKRYKEKNREFIKNIQHQYYTDNKPALQKYRKEYDKTYTQTREYKERRTNYRQEYLEKAFEKISIDRNLNGVVCQRCGESDIFKLTIAHTDGNGGEFRKSTKWSTETLCRQIINNKYSTDGLSLECFSCNWCLGQYGKYPNEMNTTDFMSSNPYHRKVRVGVLSKICGQYNRELSCRICGEKRPWCLNIAHANNDGYKEGHCRSSMLYDVYSGRRGTSDLEIECCNCNMSKLRVNRKKLR